VAELTPAIKQFSFAGGVISPRLFGRTDLERYRQSVQTCRNWIVEPTGCATNRPGTKYIAEVKTSSLFTRLIPFIALNGQAYALEFGNLYMRVFTLGGKVLFPSAGAGFHTTGDGQAALLDNTANWQVDQWVGATVTNVTDGSSGTVTANTVNTVTATLSGGTDDDWDENDEYTLALSSPGVFEAVSPYVTADLRQIKYAQQNDVLILVHPDHRPQTLKRLADDEWILEPFSVIKEVAPPASITISGQDVTEADDFHPNEDWAWCATAIDRNGRESLPSPVVSTFGQLYLDSDKPLVLINPSSQGNLPRGYNVYRSRGHSVAPLSDGYWGFVGFTEHVGAQTDQQKLRESNTTPDFTDSPPTERDPFTEVESTQLIGEEELVALTGSTPFWDGNDGSSVAAYEDGYTYQVNIQLLPGEFVTFQIEAREDVDPDPWTIIETVFYENTSSETITFTSYRVVKISGIFVDPWKRFGVRLLPLQSSPTIALFSPVVARWNDAVASEKTMDSFPASVGFFEQRLVFGGFTHNQQLFRLSRTGDIFNFDKKDAVRADDSFDLVVASLRIDAIRQLVPSRSLVVLTAGGEWQARGQEGGPLTPISFDVKMQTAYGASQTAQALPIADSLLYVTERGRKLRELMLDPYGQQNRTRDLSVMVEHLFRQHEITELHYADQPYQVLWGIREDGTLLGLTYVREHNIYAWHTHDTGGVRTDGVPRDKYESLCSVPEGDESTTYAIVKRSIGGGTFRYVEVFSTRQFVDQEDAVFLDSALTYDGRNTGATQLKLTPVTGKHDAATHPTRLTDSGESWAADEWKDNIVKNVTDGSQGTCLSNTGTQIILDDLTGGVDDQWENTDDYEITPTWVAQEKVHLESDTASTFVAGDVGTEFELRRQAITDNGLTVTDYKVRVTATRLISDQVMEVTLNAPPDVKLQGVYTSDWGQAFNTFSGLNHLEGETVGVLVDAATHQTRTVLSGAITLDSGIFAERLQVGIPYTSDIVTLPLDVLKDEGSIRTAKKLVPTIYVEVDAYRGLWVGGDLNHLTEAKERAVEEAYESISTENTLVAIRPATTWSRQVNVAVRQVDPLPVSLLSIITGVRVGGNV
jgi:hypothetical protein